MPQDIQARIDKLLADAADCELICNLSTDVRKRAAFARLASQYTAMAEALRDEVAALINNPNNSARVRDGTVNAGPNAQSRENNPDDGRGSPSPR